VITVRTVSVRNIRAGKTVLNIGKKGVPVKTIDPCKHKRRGVPKIHVNGKYCYDTAGLVEIRETVEDTPES